MNKMKRKHLLLCLFLGLFAAFTLSAKDKVIVNPAYEFTTSGIFHISKIELGKEELRMYIHAQFIPDWWVRFTKANCFIEDDASGRRWQVMDIRNGEFDEKIFMPDSGDSTFVLIFPKPDKSVAKINYIDNDDGDKTGIFGISLNPKTKQPATSIPLEVSARIDNELANAKRKTLMDVDGNEFFVRDTARLVGYIKGYDPRAGFSTGIIYAENVVTREDFPIVVQIHEDGRFEGNIPMNYPEYLSVFFQNHQIDFYLEPGQTLSIILDWKEFLTADRRRNIRYEIADIQFAEVTADINWELTAFNAKLPDIPYGQVYEELDKKTPDEFKVFYDELLADYTAIHKRLLDTEELSKRTKVILQNSYKMMYAMYLFEYEMRYKDNNTLPLEYYAFLQDIPMDDRQLLSTPNFSIFINRLEYCAPFMTARYKVYKSMSPSKKFDEYLFDELGIPKTAEDSFYQTMQDSINIKLNLPDATEEMQKKWMEEFSVISQEFINRHGEKRMEEYKKKYLDVIKQLTPLEITIKQQEITDSVYFDELKLKPGILYDITKVQELDYLFGNYMKDNRNDAQFVLSHQKSNIQDAFLKEEAERIFLKNFPLEKPAPYELPDTKEANMFKELIAPFKGKILYVDFWATTCGPCVYNIKHHKSLREKYKDSEDVAFVFVTSDDESPLDNYNKFVEEQELVNTYRLSADNYRYLRQLFRFNGIPRYIIIDREGRVLNDNAGSHQFEQDLKEILENEN
jgi:thiol-disulfide isomerase/thioredoxin